MKSILFVALFTVIFATVNAATSTTLVQQPSGVVCAQTVCPTYTQALEKRATPTCPSTCPDSCSIIDDVCCPGIQKAVCNSSSGTSTTAGVVTNTGAVTTATSTISPSVVSSGASSVAPTSASVSSPVATSTTNTSNANTVQYMLSVTITMMLITIYLLQ